MKNKIIAPFKLGQAIKFKEPFWTNPTQGKQLEVAGYGEINSYAGEPVTWGVMIRNVLGGHFSYDRPYYDEKGELIPDPRKKGETYYWTSTDEIEVIDNKRLNKRELKEILNSNNKK